MQHLSLSGFCKYHLPTVIQCREIAVSSGQRCRAKWGVDDNGYCKDHARQDVSYQCVAIASSTGRRCRVCTGINDTGFCGVHTARVQYKPLCQGFTRTGEPCINVSKYGYSYCCATHNPWIAHIPPSILDGAERSVLDPLIIQHYNNLDLYHRETLDLETPGFVELDHIFEKQCFTFAFQNMSLTNEDKDFLIALIRDEYVNEIRNVCLTRSATNRMKGAAVYKFLDDLRTGHIPENAIFSSYLRNQRHHGKRLGRNTVRVVVREMGHALKKCQLQLAAQGETPALKALSDELEHLFTLMNLKVY